MFSESAGSTSQRSGFGLVELLISISIITIVASIVLTRQSSFNSAVLLRGQAYEIAFAIREVQLSAVSSSGGAGTFRDVLGVHFDSSASTNGTFRIFRDANTNGYYDGASEEFGPQGLLDPRYEIRAVRAVGGDALTGGDVSILFVRPDFDARFFDGPGTSGEVTTNLIEIDVARRGSSGTGPGDVRTVEVTSTGQISVQ